MPPSSTLLPWVAILLSSMSFWQRHRKKFITFGVVSAVGAGGLYLLNKYVDHRIGNVQLWFTSCQFCTLDGVLIITQKIKSRILLTIIFFWKNSVKLCLHLSYIAQNSFHFDEIFHRKFKIPISVCVSLRRHLVAILGIFGTKIDLPL